MHDDGEPGRRSRVLDRDLAARDLDERWWRAHSQTLPAHIQAWAIATATSIRRDNRSSRAYLRCGLPTAAAYAPIYVIQAAAVETNLNDLRPSDSRIIGFLRAVSKR
jgi:hypothetical protein